MRRALALVAAAALAACTAHVLPGRTVAPGAPVAPAAGQSGPTPVRIVREGESYRLLVDGRPFVIRGAGLDGGDQEALAARGANSFRTWRPGTERESGSAMLDRARRNGLYVALGIPMPAPRHGFDYRDAAAVDREIMRVRQEVLRYREHPALLMWVVGNELNLESTDTAVWDAIGRIATMIHALDPHHPVMTTLAGVDPAVVAALRARAPALDLIGVQLYGDLDRLGERMRASGWPGPYVVTEWGPTGHWESTKTAWGAPIEEDASRKAARLVERYRERIAAESARALGSYVFLWGQKQERTPTWYGLFLPTGESTPAVDAMQYLWTGAWPANRAPEVAPLRLDGRTALDSPVLAPGAVNEARIDARDVDGDVLRYRWTLREESRATSSGGDPETVPREVPLRVRETPDGRLRLDAPSMPGAYRLFVEVHDGRGHAAYANIPFLVAPATPNGPD